MSGVPQEAVDAVRAAFERATDEQEAAIHDVGDVMRFILSAAYPAIRRAVIEELIAKAPLWDRNWLRAELEEGR